MRFFRSKRSWLCVALAWACVLPAPVFGADEDLLFAEIPTVYAAARHEQPVTQAPATVTVITRADIRQYGYRTLAQALASVPGFFLTNDRGYEYIGVRGLGIPTDYNTRLLFLLNGLPVNDKYYGTFVQELTPDLFDTIERIEVVKGPASPLFGSDALLATVNIITRKGAGIGGAMVSAEGAVPAMGRGVFTYGNVFTNGLDLMLSGQFGAAQGEHSISFGSFGKARDADEQRLASAFLSARYGEWFLQLWYADRYKEIPTGQYLTVLGDSRTHYDDAWYLAELRWQHPVSDTVTLMMRGYGQFYPYAAAFVTNATSSIYYESTRDTWAGYEAQVDWRPFDHHQLTLGMLTEYHWTELDGHYSDLHGQTTFVYPGSVGDFAYWAVYLQDEFRILPQLTLTAGARYDAYPQFDKDHLSPRAAVVWTPTRGTTVKLLYGEAFRVPSEYERTYAYGSGLDGGVYPRTLDIAPEQIRTYELVLEQHFRRGLTGRLSGFYNDVTKLIGQPQPEPLTFANLVNARTQGVEAELSQTFTNGLRAFLNGTWQNTAANGREALMNSPHWLANAGVVWPVCGDKLAVALRENFVSPRATREPAWRTGNAFLTDLTLTSDGWLPRWSFAFGVRNLFGARNVVPAGEDGTVTVIPQPGRLFFLRATYRF